MFVKHRCPQRHQSQNMAKILHFDPNTPHGHVMSVKCEEPIDELTIQVWLLYDHPNLHFGCTCTWDGIMDRRTDDLITRCPWWTFQAGGIIHLFFFNGIYLCVNSVQIISKFLKGRPHKNTFCITLSPSLCYATVSEFSPLVCPQVMLVWHVFVKICPI